MTDRSVVRLFWGLLLLELAALFLLLCFVLVWPAWAADRTANLANLHLSWVLENDCQAQIVQALQELPGGARYDPAANTWSLVGISGERRRLRIRDTEFSLMQVYYRREETSEPGMLWTALEMRTGDGRRFSALEDSLSPKEVQYLFRPGRLQVRLSLSGRFVSPQGVNCTGWQDGSFTEGFPFCAVEELQVVGASGKLIAGFDAPANPLDGFVFWQIQPEQRLDLCRPLGPKEPR